MYLLERVLKLLSIRSLYEGRQPLAGRAAPGPRYEPPGVWHGGDSEVFAGEAFAVLVKAVWVTWLEVELVLFLGFEVCAGSVGRC
jgi:hypothetical protein